jgi:hypothetical protein
MPFRVPSPHIQEGKSHNFAARTWYTPAESVGSSSIEVFALLSIQKINYPLQSHSDLSFRAGSGCGTELF